MKRNGFTMIEFLVVAALIGILVVMGASSYSGSLSRGRDAKRVSDMKDVQKGFEMYYSLEGEYTSCDEMLADERVFPNGFPEDDDYLPGTCDADEYLYCAVLENEEDYGNYDCDVDETDPDNPIATCTYANTGQTHFCVANVQ